MSGVVLSDWKTRRNEMKALVARLLKGLDTQARPDGSVIRVRAGKQTVAEVCVGKSSVRANFKTKPTIKSDVKLAGSSASWKGGGTVVTEENVAGVRRLIEAAVAGAGAGKSDQPEPPKPSRLRPAQPDKKQTDKPKAQASSSKRTGVQPFAKAA
jgi:hypothetical protein